ncbi:hypothetical protein FHR32_006089 [Streptosporangium album]|uniref:AI2M/AI1M-like HNH endonuclease domain-containing protein n=2 Tax=Streptosporangium album TaxID=47479 RepID=A0A7W7WBM6_9ACTN|nr:hypothetical protein [Streptosporangium album]MBB4941712.1 hypothetical protein [Streptosporangium album]
MITTRDQREYTLTRSHQAPDQHLQDETISLVARFGGIPLQRQRMAAIIDRQPVRVDYPRKELIKRLLADTCELCQRTDNIQVHHVRKLADLARPGQHQPVWMRAMAKRRRKSLVVCDACHAHIHAGQSAAPLTQ